MRTGIGWALICVGAILAFAVTANTSVFNLHTAGWIIMIVGLIGLVTPRRMYGWVGRRLLLRRTRTYPATRVEEIDVPAYSADNPGPHVRAGLPQRGPDDTEVIEDVYER
jgi:Domain of unknown function (DUF6458)